MALGFKPERDEPWRPAEPDTLAESGANESMLEAIIYRYLLNIGECEGRRIADQVKLPFRMIEPVMARLKMEQNVAYKSSTATNDYVYQLTESGRNIARNHASDSTYFGACPVALKDYIASVKMQTIEGQYPKRQDLLRCFSDLLINPKMLEKLGPAVASGRGMFLFGFPGNGKTSIAERVTGAFGKYVWVPAAVDVDGDVMRVFDPMNHEVNMPEAGSGILDIGGYDKRWVRIERPTIVAGGELTMEMLEVACNQESNISEAPLQLKSNCGTLVIDDFGRQKMRVDELLNRWIVPLEKRYDFLNMASGKKIQVPFDQLVVFSTNLEPKDLVDDAFLRRIPYKIEAENPPEEDFRKLFEIMCKVTKVPYDKGCIDYLIETHYKPVDRPMRMCQPRDLLLQVKNYCLYNDLPIELKNSYMDFACDNYFSVM
jgi:predicted transcriptional regulator